MDVQTLESDLKKRPIPRWLAREKESGRIYDWATYASAALFAGMLVLSYLLLTRGGAPGTMLSPGLIAVLLIGNLIPAIALMVLLSRRIARARAVARAIGTGQLHTRMVALFSVIAAVPTVIIAIFASFLLQSGLEFWFSDRAKGMLENTAQLAQSTYTSEVNRVGGEAVTMVSDFYKYMGPKPMANPRFDQFVAYQTYQRGLNEAAVIRVTPNQPMVVLSGVNYVDGLIDPSRVAQALAQLKGDTQAAEVVTQGRIAVITPLTNDPGAYLYVAQQVTSDFRKQIESATGVLTDYRELLERSRINQLQFNAALLALALIVAAGAIFAALKIADRLLRPVEELVDAAGRIEEGDFTARVPIIGDPDDELATLGTAFNRMTGKLQEQTGALISANEQLDTRRAFIEAVLSSVTAGVIALDGSGRILLTNRSAETLMQRGGNSIEGSELGDVSPELGEFLSGESRDADVLVHLAEGQRTLAVKRMRYADGSVLTFDDITDQLSDQRRAAWSDIARRIAHEIKNPLTPIQLAAERLQRRYGEEVTSDPETFARLTDTIVRQVGDLRRMVDEFSNFARMPKPVFRDENVHDIARAALFLHEVAHPGISFSIDPPSGDIRMVCDRRQLSQALTNIVKNAVEAIELRRNRGEQHSDGDRIDLCIKREADQLVVDLTDTGVGLPEDRERLTEPYMTTRVRGTGLGLAIVKKIVEEHLGEIAFLDRTGGGTRVRIAFDADRLEALATEEPNAAAPGEGEDEDYDEEDHS
ncbi:ATP-binding protein [Sphingomonas sp. RB56-2]|uniref:histidine kinase n=1 Tax=Sphingomonas brevis TaxID=2908206 RepID=A0ABT0S833_9SPHN|nr:ATP-binding protein [Sphingomonas brevis]MCL6740279.1 ATP-binding protein [Sphingomonas brevis]